MPKFNLKEAREEEARLWREEPARAVENYISEAVDEMLRDHIETEIARRFTEKTNEA